MTAPVATPRDEYTRRQAQRAAIAAALGRTDDILANARLLVFAVGLGVAALGPGAGWFSSWWLVGPIIAFAALASGGARIACHGSRLTYGGVGYEDVGSPFP